MDKSRFASKILLFGRYAIYITYPFLILFLVFLIYISSSLISERNRMPNMIKTMKSGNQIAQGLEEYRIDTGHYPRSLNDLVPKYLSNLPKPYWGNSGWVYESDELSFSLETGFRLGQSLYPVIYLIAPNRWQTNG